MLSRRDMDEMHKALNGLLQLGRVDSVDEDKHTARVEFADVDGSVSYDFPVMVRRRGEYGLPDVGALAVCIVPPGTTGVGFVLGVIYSDEDTPPTDTDIRVVRGETIRLSSSSATIAVALSNAVDDNQDTIQQAFDVHVHTTNATIGPSAVVGTLSVPTNPIGQLPSTAADKVFAE